MPDRPYVRWEFRAAPMPDDPGQRRWHQEAVAMHAADGTEIWRRTLPERMRAPQAGIGDAEVEGHRRFPETTHGLYFLIGIGWTETAVAVADGSGVLVLSRSDGETLLDAPMEQGGDDRFWFDRGEFRVLDAQGNLLGSGPSRGGRFFAPCGPQWIAFNGRTLLALALAPPAARARARYGRKRHFAGGPSTLMRARIPLGELLVELEGAVHL